MPDPGPCLFPLRLPYEGGGQVFCQLQSDRSGRRHSDDWGRLQFRPRRHEASVHGKTGDHRERLIVCPGVTIGDGCVIGAGSVVTRDIPPLSFAAGNPCRVIREITEKERIVL
ncbi:MAG: hypothetical protein IKI23_07785 [Lachnospiraceae bacterium]|nr:hypothetical protein [Lachnospiraceae bacterium]